ncbi:right-handed parallel beta-helix repeat-containing protein [Paraglaciecola sp. L1A13]|uniref:right-handed parallel beta-helix repeat-containing protein n=1 Tax=Paraglaciecola sp. L1A13 TaxID=2686359 RepID=UPI001E4BC281|nr:right-handed parallel beta-helix repeat-containing protein [Paraglaciecola sp. L1A13]|tara:strand:- start:954 stop:3521 length:2568 start_codon:yes stop_codon:yes gene_type:complete
MYKSSKATWLGVRFTLIFMIISMIGCSRFHAPQKLSVTSQPGSYLISKIKEQQLNSQSEVVAMLQNPAFTSKKSNSFITKNRQNVASLLLEIMASQNVTQAVIHLSETEVSTTEKWVTLALQLYPIDAYRIVEQLYADSTIETTTLESAALLAGLNPARIFPATASSDTDYRIVPLIHSASLTVYNQNEDTKTRLWFKLNASTDWLPALTLQWEPIKGALSGSIVHLEPDTTYDVKLEYLDDNQVVDEQLYTFQTRPNTPPIDPDKIYYLSDIYTGGQLNLTTLGIQGTEEGWALIKGDGTDIVAGENDNAAIDIGSQSYVKFENITVKGGRLYGIGAKQAHHLWIDGCDISEFGRVGEDMRDGVAYANAESTKAINYDSGISLQESGVVTIENCEIHSPNGKANHWGYGHPYGPSALLLTARHSVEEYRGQYIIRNNRFYGSDNKRFNDVIESRANGRPWGGFIRDSAIYNNYFAFANDDIIELDGGQSNVLFYNNEIEQGYCGISAIPNMLGPSYIFNNYIHNLGDERQKAWAAIKLGGLMSMPAGQVNIFENLIVTSSNGIAAAGFKSDYTFWANIRNNVLVHDVYWNKMGYGIYDSEQYENSKFKNNLIFNSRIDAPAVLANLGDDFYHPWSEQAELIEDIDNSAASFNLELEARFIIPNFSSMSPTAELAGSQVATDSDTNDTDYLVNFNDGQMQSFDSQDEASDYLISDNGSTLTLTGNTWQSMAIDIALTSQTMLSLEVKNNGAGEIAGIAFENDNKLTSSRMYKFTGSQNWANDSYKYSNIDEFETITMPIGDLITGEFNRIVFVMDDDQPKYTTSEVSYKNVKFYEPAKMLQSASNSMISVGLTND